MTGSLTRKQGIQGGLWGLLIGDALGVPYEFYHPTDLPPNMQLEMESPIYFQVRSWIALWYMVR